MLTARLTSFLSPFDGVPREPTFDYHRCMRGFVSSHALFLYSSTPLTVLALLYIFLYIAVLFFWWRQYQGNSCDPFLWPVERRFCRAPTLDYRRVLDSVVHGDNISSHTAFDSFFLTRVGWCFDLHRNDGGTVVGTVSQVNVGPAGLRCLLDPSSCPRLTTLILTRLDRVNDRCLRVRQRVSNESNFC